MKKASEIVIGDRIGSQGWEVKTITAKKGNIMNWIVFNAGTSEEIRASEGAMLRV